MPSIATTVRVESLFDATALYCSGERPWTIFAYPTITARPNGLPPDDEVQMLLAELQQRGVPLAVWCNGSDANTTYVVCRYEDRIRVEHAINDLERQAILEPGFLADHSAKLFAVGRSATS